MNAGVNFYINVCPVANATIIIITTNNISNPPKIKNNIIPIMTNTFLKVNFINKSTKNCLTMCERIIYTYLPPPIKRGMPPALVEISN